MYSNIQDMGIYKMSKIESEIIILRARELIVHLKIHRHTLAALLKEGLPRSKKGEGGSEVCLPVRLQPRLPFLIPKRVNASTRLCVSPLGGAHLNAWEHLQPASGAQGSQRITSPLDLQPKDWEGDRCTIKCTEGCTDPSLAHPTRRG